MSSWKQSTGAKRQFNMAELKFVVLVMGQRLNQELGLLIARLVEGQVCKLFDKARSSCRLCAEFVMEREE